MWFPLAPLWLIAKWGAVHTHKEELLSLSMLGPAGGIRHCTFHPTGNDWFWFGHNCMTHFTVEVCYFDFRRDTALLASLCILVALCPESYNSHHAPSWLPAKDLSIWDNKPDVEAIAFTGWVILCMPTVCAHNTPFNMRPSLIVLQQTQWRRVFSNCRQKKLKHLVSGDYTLKTE